MDKIKNEPLPWTPLRSKPMPGPMLDPIIKNKDAINNWGEGPPLPLLDDKKIKVD